MKNAHKYDETGVTAHRTGSLSALHSSAPQISDFLVYHDYRFQYFQVFFFWIQWLTLNRGWSSYHLISRACVLQFLLVFHFQKYHLFSLKCNTTHQFVLVPGPKSGDFCFPSSNKKHGTQFELWCLPPTQVCNFSEMMILATFFFQKRSKIKTKTRRQEDSKKRPHTKIRAKK